MKAAAVMLMIVTVVTGCRTQSALVRDNRLYDTGVPKSDGMIDYRDGGRWQFGRSSEYYPDGRLKRIEWTSLGRPMIALTFHENGRLESEEHFEEHVDGPKIVFAVYYDEEGVVTKTIGHRFGAKIEPPTVTREQAIRIARGALDAQHPDATSAVDGEPTDVVLSHRGDGKTAWSIRWDRAVFVTVDAYSGEIQLLHVN